jgi:hypothetical protein
MGNAMEGMSYLSRSKRPLPRYYLMTYFTIENKLANQLCNHESLSKLVDVFYTAMPCSSPVPFYERPGQSYGRPAWHPSLRRRYSWALRISWNGNSSSKAMASVIVNFCEATGPRRKPADQPSAPGESHSQEGHGRRASS